MPIIIMILIKLQKKIIFISHGIKYYFEMLLIFLSIMND